MIEVLLIDIGVFIKRILNEFKVVEINLFFFKIDVFKIMIFKIIIKLNKIL